MDIDLNAEPDQEIEEGHADGSQTNAIVQVVNKGMVIICNPAVFLHKLSMLACRGYQQART